MNHPLSVTHFKTMLEQKKIALCLINLVFLYVTDRKNMEDDCKGSRRGKPQQQFYQPGSGPLKKTPDDIDQAKPDFHNTNDAPRRGHGRHRGRGHFNNKDNNRHNDDLSEKLTSVNISQNDDQKKSFKPRKPEQQLYVPKSRTVSERDDNNKSPLFSDMWEGMSRSTGNIQFNETNFISDRLNPEFNDPHNNHEAKSKRYSGHRRHINDANERRDPESIRRNDNRQNSEPRNMSPARKNPVENHVSSRNRDTRSMESSAPRYSHHTNGGKPPSGRRNSTVTPGGDGNKPWCTPQNFESMPPRFKKKYLVESGLLKNEEGPPATWNGDSMVFQGTSNHHYPPNHPPQSWSHTLPMRGRGRHREDDFEKSKRISNNVIHNFESGSDSRSSTPHTPYSAVPPAHKSAPANNSNGILRYFISFI